ncbi:right-handed parallel beta-helix repeat-containing protein [Thermogutta sp.]|uniref:right-handed parallel beta-helix repeat-containing protein n=1 Tax=Thermogutta sp. TaxID=1962930 RepID=UPI003C7E07D4
MRNLLPMVRGIIQFLALCGLGFLGGASSATPPLRNYVFDESPLPLRESASLGTEKAPLRLPVSASLPSKQGRTDQSETYILDTTAYEGPPFDASQGFTIEVVFRQFGQGSQLGNGRPNGMIFAQGDGYWHGLRLYCDTSTGRLHFEMGRPQPRNAFGISSPLGIPRGVWQHVAVTWDRQQLRLFWNGVLVAASPYDEAYTPPNGPLRIGYADAGVGSLRLQVAQWVVYAEALSPAVVAEHALSAIPGPMNVDDTPSHFGPPTFLRWQEATEQAASGKWREAGEMWAALAVHPQASSEIRALGRFAGAVAKRLYGATGQAVVDWAALSQGENVPEIIKLNAAASCLFKTNGTLWALPIPQLYESLLQMREWSAEERTTLLLLAGEAALQAGTSAIAQKRFVEALDSPSLTESQRWDVKLRMAHALREGQQWNEARDAYRDIAENPQAPSPVRSLSWLGWASTYERAGQWREAAQAYRKVAAMEDVYPVHRWEAEELAREMERLGEGLPRRDPQWHRTPIPAFPTPGLVLHVAPHGNDAHSGTADAPLASLAAARDRIRQIRKEQSLPRGGITVLVHRGIYRMSETLELTEEDSGTADSPIVYRAADNETPVFTGGTVLTGAEPVRDHAIRDRLPQSVRDKVLQIDLRANGIKDLGSLGPRGFGLAGYPAHPWVDVYFNDRPGTLARWPNEGFLAIQGLATPAGDAGAGKPAVWKVEGRPLGWAPSDDIWMFGYWRYLWAGTTIQVAKIDPQSRQLTTAGSSGYGFGEGMPYYFFNVLEELDQPGEWYLDRTRGILYFYPPGDISKLRITFPTLATPFVRMKNCAHVRLVKLTFECGRAEGVVIEGGQEVALLGCRIMRLGTNGVIILGGAKHLVMGCDIGTLGAGGIRLAGGDEKTLTPSGHIVENCHIWEFSRVDRNYAPAVHADGVGSIIRHNLLHDSPHHGMRLEGFDHLVELNEVHSVVYEADDQSGIDMFGNPVSRGNVLRWNFWHHIGSGHNVAGQAGIRLDDMISGVVVYGNVFYRSAGGWFGGLQIHGGKDNWVDNNLFIDCKAAISFSPWSESRWVESVQRWLENARGRGLDVTKPPFSTRYPELLDLESHPNRNFILRSLVVNCGEFAIRDPGVNVFLDNHVAEGDIGFESVSERRFGLKSEAKPFQWFYFRAIPFDEIGLYPSPVRATWPVEHSVSPKYMAE